MSKIKPQIPKGFRDFLPSQKVTRQHVIDTIRNVFEVFGFEPLETPALEYASILEGKYGEEGEKLIYKFEDRGGRKVALRYDLTIPLSRVIAMYPTLPKPFKCYQISPVWRADKPQKGRFREFWQCDADIVGSESMFADAEVITTIHHILKALNFKQFTIKINNRKLLNGIAQSLGFPVEKITSLLRIIDKLDKKGMEGIKDEMRQQGFPDENINNILELFIVSKGNHNELVYLKSRFSDSPLVREGIQELDELFSHLSSMDVDSNGYCFDLSLARGLDYYTGPIFETTVDEPKIGSISGGGRYDNLIGMFSDTDFPATGSSFGLERVIAVMEELNIVPSHATTTEVLMTRFSPDMHQDSLQVASALRSAGIKTDVYFTHDKLKKQLTYASNKGIPIVIIQGPDEKKDSKVMLRNMIKGIQKTVALDDLAFTIKQELNEL